jgi:hypothetical protein
MTRKGGSPVDERELVVRFYGEGRSKDLAAMERALERLRSAPTTRRFPRIALVAAAAALVIAVGSISWYAAVRPDAVAMSELHRLAGVAGKHELAAGGRPVVYERYEALEPHGYDLIGGQGFTVLARVRTEIWRAPDGSQRSETDVLSTEFASAQDRLTWQELGRPETVAPGRGAPQTIPPGEIPFPDLGALPLEPEALLDSLREDWEPAPLESEEEVLLAIGDLLVRGDAEPALRQALFEAAAALDGIEDLGERTDPLGRSGVAIGLGPEDRRVVLIVDPDTSFLLAIDERRGGDDGFHAWRAYTAWSTVGSLGVRPEDSDLS